jgi:ParB family transcriptional regulator, chromosome partitioning protein
MLVYQIFNLSQEGYMPNIFISNIIIPSRIRADLGNLTELTEDIKLHGLLHPIVVNSQHELVAGYRRLQAVVSLGWTEIPVTLIDTLSSLSQFDLQLAENMKRKDLNPLEISEAILERKHRFEQVHGSISKGGDHSSQEYKSKLTNGEFAFSSFYAETANLLNKSEKYIYEFLQLNNIDLDLKEQVRDRKISYRTALEQQGERNRDIRLQKKSKPQPKSFGLPNKEDIAPMLKIYKAAPNLMKLFMLVQHTEHTIRQQQSKPMEYQNCELEFLFIFIQQLDIIIPYYQELRTQLNLTQEQKLAELAGSATPIK